LNGTYNELLIDADITCYQACISSEVEIEWDRDLWTLDTDLTAAKAVFEQLLKKYQKGTGVDKFTLCFTDGRNFRKDLNSDYKSNRKGRKPLGYTALKAWAMEKWPHYVRPGLEADDCMGILATRYPGKYIIVSLDKDMMGIPGRFFKLGINGPKDEMHNINPEDARKWFYMQVLMGDKVDGYSGIPGVGGKRAEGILKKGGVNWSTVVEAYVQAGLDEEYALKMARMAKILDHSLYDEETATIKNWTPEHDEELYGLHYSNQELQAIRSDKEEDAIFIN
jgi:DNA polymerase-1